MDSQTLENNPPPPSSKANLLDKIIIKGLLGGKAIWDPRPDVPQEVDFARRFEELCRDAHIAPPPKLLLYQGKRPNAASLVHGTIAVDSKFLDTMSPDKVDAVLGHELTHHKRRIGVLAVSLGIVVATGKLAEMVLKHYVMPAVERMKPSFVSKTLKKGVHLLALPVIFACLAVYKRYEEYVADKGGAELTSPKAMAGALESLRATYKGINEEEHAKKPEWVKAVMCSKPKRAYDRFARVVWGDHPTIERRVARLSKMHEADPALYASNQSPGRLQ